MDMLTLGQRPIGRDAPPYLIAEIGSNHNGDLDLCLKMVDSAKLCGADAVKFQSWSSRSLISKAEYERNLDYSDKKRHFGSLKEMVEAYQFSSDMHREVAAYCRQLGIDFLSTPFAPDEVELLDELGVPALKVASMDVNHPLLLEAIGATGRPVLLSTGMASMAEIGTALEVLERAESGPVVLLHCVSIYPPEPADIHLRNIPMLEQAFGVPVGFSDHTLGVAASLASVALGACLIEKHFTLDKELAGWDHHISADPGELEQLARELKFIHAALGHSRRVVSAAELAKRERFRRCAVLTRAVKAGEVLTLTDLDFKRPGTGIDPDAYPAVVGRTVRHDLDEDHELAWSDLV